MSNEALFLLSALVDILFILLAARRGREWLYGTIAVNLILVAVFGAKLITIFGLTTNAGNVFYACVFLAVHFLLERREKKTTSNVILYGAAFILFFSIMSQFTVRFVGVAASDVANGAILSLFSLSPRIFLASITAYVFAQYINIFAYEWIRARTRGRLLWLRSNGANVLSQLVDSLLFFTIAFFDLPGPLLVQTILLGWLTKVIVVALGTPFLYIDAYLGNKK